MARLRDFSRRHRRSLPTGVLFLPPWVHPQVGSDHRHSREHPRPGTWPSGNQDPLLTVLGFVYLESAPTFPYELSFILQNPCHQHTSPKPALNPHDFVGRMNHFQMWEEHSLWRHHSLCTHVCRAHYVPRAVAAPGVQPWTGETKCLPSWHQSSGARIARSREARLKHLPPRCMVCASSKKTLITLFLSPGLKQGAQHLEDTPTWAFHSFGEDLCHDE